MKTNRRWMKWIIEADADKIDVPWDRKVRHERRTSLPHKAA